MSTKMGVENLNPHCRTMDQMFSEAKKKKLWFYTSFNDLWFSPEELEKHREKRMYMWDAPTWQLRDPKEFIKKLEDEILERKKVIAEFKKRVQGVEIK